jgi:hypothetical protein
VFDLGRALLSALEQNSYCALYIAPADCAGTLALPEAASSQTLSSLSSSGVVLSSGRCEASLILNRPPA